MPHNLDYELERTTGKCFLCTTEFSLYKIQEVPQMNLCGNCRSPKLSELLSVFGTLTKIARFAETNKVRINDRDAVYLDELVEYLQK